MQRVPQRNTPYFEATVQFLYEVSAGFRALVLGRSWQGLLDEEKIKYTFTMLESQFKYLTAGIENNNDFNADGLIQPIFENLNGQLQALHSFCFGLINPIKLFYLQQRSSTNKSEDEQFAQRYNDFAKSVQELFDECFNLLSNLQPHLESYSRNSFSLADNEVYKSLATHPVFIFHKYKTLLKYILTNEAVYQAFIQLNMTNKQFVDEKGEKVALHDVFIKDELIRMEELQESLLSTEDFINFLEEHGHYAFQLIKEEFEIEREKYRRKEHPDFDYTQLVDALDIGRMENAFVELCDLCDIVTNINEVRLL